MREYLANYMTEYLPEWRQGKRRSDAKKPAARTVAARVNSDKRRKRLWFVENKEWCAQQQRERRRLARQEAEKQLLVHVAPAPKKAARERPKSRSSERKAA